MLAHLKTACYQYLWKGHLSSLYEPPRAVSPVGPRADWPLGPRMLQDKCVKINELWETLSSGRNLESPNSSWAQSEASLIAPPEPRGRTKLPCSTNLVTPIWSVMILMVVARAQNLWMVLSANGCNCMARNWVQVKMERKSLAILSIKAWKKDRHIYPLREKVIC